MLKFPTKSIALPLLWLTYRRVDCCKKKKIGNVGKFGFLLFVIALHGNQFSSFFQVCDVSVVYSWLIILLIQLLRIVVVVRQELECTIGHNVAFIFSKRIPKCYDLSKRGCFVNTNRIIKNQVTRTLFQLL